MVILGLVNHKTEDNFDLKCENERMKLKHFPVIELSAAVMSNPSQIGEKVGNQMVSLFLFD